MSERQETVVTRLVAAAMGIELTPARWAAIERRDDQGSVAERLAAIGGTIGIGYLARALTAEQLRSSLAEPSTPLLLYAEDAPEVVVLRPGRVETGDHVVAVSATGDERPLAGDVDAIESAVRRLLGDAPRALAPLALTPPPPISRSGEPPEEGPSVIGKPTKEVNIFVQILAFLARDKRDIVVVFFYASLAGLFSLTLPLSVGGIVQLIQGGLILQPVVILIAYVVVGSLVAGWLQVLQLGVVERIQQRVFARMALEFTFRVPRIRYETAMQEELPEAMNRLFEAVAIQKSLSKFLLDTSQALLTVLVGLVLLTFYHPYFSLFGLLLLAVLGLILWISGPKGFQTSLMESKYKYRAVHWLEELARALHAFKFGGHSSLALRRMDDVLTGYLAYRRKHFRVLVQQTVSIVVFRTAIIAGLLILGSVLVIDRQITLGQFVASELVIITVLAGVEKLILSMSTIYDILTSVRKASHVADLPLDDEASGTLPPSAAGMAVEARDVTYRYAPGAPPALRGLSVRIAPGERVGVTGFEGNGRSTLLRLLGGLLNDYDGTVLFDGTTLRTLDRISLREQIGQYLSTSDLFDGTVEENIAVGRPGIGRAEVAAAAEAAGLTADIEAMPRGLDTAITHAGRRLPLQVAVKLLFAQAIAGRPRLLVLDDLFNNLRPDDQRRLLAVLTDRSRPWTVVMVTHDPVVLAAMDRVLVIEDGRVCRDGRFEAILDDPYCRHLTETFAVPALADGR
jgi:ABC-type bacteriocin/lantibiotic exporter with double-glycine peptidase domain